MSYRPTVGRKEPVIVVSSESSKSDSQSGSDSQSTDSDSDSEDGEQLNSMYLITTIH